VSGATEDNVILLTQVPIEIDLHRILPMVRIQVSTGEKQADRVAAGNLKLSDSYIVVGMPGQGFDMIVAAQKLQCNVVIVRDSQPNPHPLDRR
jgi:hypothetical protein